MNIHRILRGTCLAAALLAAAPLAAAALDLAVVAKERADVRRTADDNAELVTQVLYGDPLDILETAGAWYRVSVHYQADRAADGARTAYTGWIRAVDTATPGGAAVRAEWLTGRRVVLVNRKLGLYVAVHDDAAAPRFLALAPEGAVLPALGEAGTWTRVRLPDGKTGRVAADQVRPFDGAAAPASFTDDFLFHARKHLGKPYLWGGASPAGVDCSGLVYLAARCAGGLVPRDAAPQHALLARVAAGEARPGDLVFFRGAKPGVNHVAILVEAGKLLHAAGKDVHESALDSAEIRARTVVGWARVVPAAGKPVDKTVDKPGGKPADKRVDKPAGPRRHSVYLMSLTRDDFTVKLLTAVEKLPVGAVVRAVPARGGLYRSVSLGLYADERAAQARLRALPTAQWSRNATLQVLPLAGKGREAWTVQVTVYDDPFAALGRLARLGKKGMPVWLKVEKGRRGQSVFALCSGWFAERALADQHRAALKKRQVMGNLGAKRITE